VTLSLRYSCSPDAARAYAEVQLICVLAAAGCGGARINVTADRARYPLSISSVVRDASGRPYDARTLVKVGWLERIGRI